MGCKVMINREDKLTLEKTRAAWGPPSPAGPRPSDYLQAVVRPSEQLRHWHKLSLEFAGRERKKYLQAFREHVTWLEREQGGTPFVRLYVGLALCTTKQLAKDVKFS